MKRGGPWEWLGALALGVGTGALFWWANTGKTTRGKMARIFHRERADGVDMRIQSALDWWADNGPFDIEIGYMGGNRTRQTQAGLFAQGRDAQGNIVDKSKVVTYAKTADDSAHGHGGGVDVWPYFNGTGHPNRDTDEEKAKYSMMVSLLQAQGLVSGSTFPNLADWPHFEVADWRSLPILGDDKAYA